MRHLLPITVGALWGLLAIAAACASLPPPVVPDPPPPAPGGDGYATCVAVAEFSEGVRNVAAASGMSAAEAAKLLCESPELRACYAEGRCK